MEKIGERTVWLDCDVLQGDGGTRTASITGAFIALVDAFNKIKKDGMISVIPVREFVAATSVGIVNGQMMLDLAYEEDSRADVDMNVVMTSAGEFIEIQGTAERVAFNKNEMTGMLSFAQTGIERLIDMQRQHLKGIL